MNIQLNTYEVETLEYILDKFIFQQRQKALDDRLYHRIQTMIRMQREKHIECVMVELRAQIKRGESPSISALQRQEGKGYVEAALLIEQAKAEVEAECNRLNTEWRKDYEAAKSHE